MPRLRLHASAGTIEMWDTRMSPHVVGVNRLTVPFDFARGTLPIAATDLEAHSSLQPLSAMPCKNERPQTRDGFASTLSRSGHLRLGRGGADRRMVLAFGSGTKSFRGASEYSISSERTAWRSGRIHSFAIRLRLQTRRAFAGDNRPQLREASCCRPTPEVVDPSADRISQFFSPFGICNQPAFATLGQKSTFYQHGGNFGQTQDGEAGAFNSAIEFANVARVSE